MIPPSPLPEELKGWNWGAFLLNWVWGLGNRTYIAFLTLIPGANFIMPFVLGAKGNEWAWRNDNWRDVEHFKKVQRTWAWVGVASYICIFGLIALMVMGITNIIKSSEPYNLSLAMAQDDIRVEQLLGTPIEAANWVTRGSINTQNESGEAAISYDISGPKGNGTLHVSALREHGTWTITGVVLTTPEETLDLME